MSLSPRPNKGRGFGCGAIAILALIAFSVPAIRMGQAVWKAKQAEQVLNDTLGEAPSYVPPAEGAIPADRIERFLRVREQVFAYCGEFQGRLDEQIRLEDIESDPDLSKPEALREGFGGLREILRGGSAFVQFMEARNKALLEEGMGLGEYMYIYVLAYHENLQLEDTTRFAPFEEAYLGGRARRELARILQNQVTALEAEQMNPNRREVRTALRREIAALAEGDRFYPWEDGLPTQLAASIEPYVGALDALYCSGLAKTELSQKNKGFDIQN